LLSFFRFQLLVFRHRWRWYVSEDCGNV